MNTKTQTTKRMGTVRQFIEAYPAFTTGGTRSLLFSDQDCFRTDCALKIGAKILIDFDAVDTWLDAHREAA